MLSRGEHGAKGGADTFYDSFRWMEQNDGPDLRLGFDDFQHNYQEQALPKPQHVSHRRSFRRHLSISKKTFSRPSSMAGPSRPGTKDTVTAPSLRSTPSPVPGSQNDHVRRKSKALSLISLNKLAARQPSMTIDPAAAHYQDPGTRTTLREYIASPQKFDEALEYGFPSLGEVEENDHSELKHVPPTFLDDDKSSTHSTVSDCDSPKTPPILEKPRAIQSTQTCTDPIASSQVRCSSTSTNPREMTLRMTLTRPDLRAHEDHLYGWNSSVPVRQANMRDEPLTPALSEKETMEKHFAALDQENMDTHNDDGVVRRFWKRVRRS